MNEQPTRTTVRRAVQHPSAGEEWFRALPHAHRARMNREWRAGLAHDDELVHGERRRALVSAGRMALLYGVLDLGCPGSSLSSCVLVALLGAMLGVLLEKLRAARLLSGTLGLLAFVAAQWLTRDGLSAAHLFWFFPAGAISAYLGVAREEWAQLRRSAASTRIETRNELGRFGMELEQDHGAGAVRGRIRGVRDVELGDQVAPAQEFAPETLVGVDLHREIDEPQDALIAQAQRDQAILA